MLWLFALLCLLRTLSRSNALCFSCVLQHHVIITIVNITTSPLQAIVGVGILSFPYAMHQTGVVLGVLFLLLTASLVNYTMQLLVKVKTQCQHKRERFDVLHC